MPPSIVLLKTDTPTPPSSSLVGRSPHYFLPFLSEAPPGAPEGHCEPQHWKARSPEASLSGLLRRLSRVIPPQKQNPLAEHICTPWGHAEARDWDLWVRCGHAGVHLRLNAGWRQALCRASGPGLRAGRHESALIGQSPQGLPPAPPPALSPGPDLEPSLALCPGGWV